MCDCGTVKVINKGDFFNTKSCGCARGEFAITHGKTKSREYKSWVAMKERCLNPKNKNYKNYGAKGVSICETWVRSFENFFEDMGERPVGFSLDRIDYTGDYYKENCRWASSRDQQNNKSSNVVINHNGKLKTLSQLSDESVVSYNTFQNRVKRGWNIEDALNKPSRKHRSNQRKASLLEQ